MVVWILKILKGEVKKCKQVLFNEVDFLSQFNWLCNCKRFWVGIKTLQSKSTIGKQIVVFLKLFIHPGLWILFTLLSFFTFYCLNVCVIILTTFLGKYLNRITCVSCCSNCDLLTFHTASLDWLITKKCFTHILIQKRNQFV